MEIYYWLQNRHYWRDAHDNRIWLIEQPYFQSISPIHLADAFIQSDLQMRTMEAIKFNKRAMICKCYNKSHLVGMGQKIDSPNYHDFFIYDFKIDFLYQNRY